jgi:signal transduction histidine kinase
MMSDALGWLFSSDQFMPHGHCYLWQPATLWLNAGSDGLIAASYFAIPLALYHVVRRRRAELPFAWMPLMFAAFILLCGATHVMEIWTVWNPIYRVAGLLKLLTGAVSLATVVMLLQIMPRILQLQTPTQLQAEVQQRTSELADANARLRAEIAARDLAEQRLRAADRRKDEFLATLAHELRNPLAPIRHAVRLLDSDKLDEPSRHWARAVIGRQAQRMALLLDDLLDVSRITRGRLELKLDDVAVSSLIASAVETANPLIEARRHTLEVERAGQDVIVTADPLRLSQAIANLLTNAAKYTAEGGRIRVSTRLESDALCIVVADNGIGFDAAAREQMFEMFAQVHAADAMHAEGGLGIGLALVRALVGLHGGTVEADSAGPGQGSEFTIKLPRSLLRGAELVAAAVPVASPTADAARCRVLVTDDNRDSADTLAMVLGQSGFDTLVAYDGNTALDLARASGPAAAIIDIGMPGLTGDEVARRMRSQSWGRSMLLIAMTGWGQAQDKERSLAAGFDAHLTKPVDPQELERLLAEFLKA